MADIERLVGSNEEFGRLKLMVVYRNSEKLLTDAIGAAEGIKVVYYQRSMQFKYQGKLRAHDILSAVRYTMSLKHEEAPFEVLHTQEDVETFIESTDKSVILYESCGWFTRLAHGSSNQSYEAASSNNHTENGLYIYDFLTYFIQLLKHYFSVSSEKERERDIAHFVETLIFSLIAMSLRK
jgi:hypothetical protein